MVSACGGIGELLVIILTAKEKGLEGNSNFEDAKGKKKDLEGLLFLRETANECEKKKSPKEGKRRNSILRLIMNGDAVEKWQKKKLRFSMKRCNDSPNSSSSCDAWPLS